MNFDQPRDMEFLSLTTSLPLEQVGTILRERLDLPPFESFPEDDSSLICTAEGISYTLTWVRSAARPEAGERELGVVLTVWGDGSQAHDLGFSFCELAPRVGRVLADGVGVPVLHCRSWLRDSSNVARDHVFFPDDPRPYRPALPLPGLSPHLLLPSNETLRPRYQGPLDFAFIVHPRDDDDFLRPFPEVRLCAQPHVSLGALMRTGSVLSEVHVQTPARVLHGEILTVAHTPELMLQQVPTARRSVEMMLDYADSRQARIVGLGALLPTLTRHGRLFEQRAGVAGVTTGHTFTAVAILRYVRRLESARGPLEPLAIVGAAGSMGRAVTRLLLRDRPGRRLILRDLPTKLGVLERTPGLDPLRHHVTAERDRLREAPLVITVTNALGAILCPDDLAPGCIVLDDAQPENVSYQTLLRRPDLTVIKCLARVRGLVCPFDFGLCAPRTSGTSELAFTCLAETVALAAAGERGNFTIGDPTDEQLSWMEANADRLGIDIAPLHSFPEVGFLETPPGE